MAKVQVAPRNLDQVNFIAAGAAPRRWTRRMLAPAALAPALALALCAPASATGPSPGSLPQTSTEPGFTAGLDAQMAILWRAIRSDSMSLGQTVFFPRGAYLQMKTGAIPDPKSDYADRLIGFFDLDLAAYHRLIIAGNPSTLLRVGVNPADAKWIPAGVCENKIGYWHVPGVRLVFRRGTAVESVEVASLMSWRGVWYVVHLGPNPRPANAGTVDDFLNGPGVPGPAGGC